MAVPGEMLGTEEEYVAGEGTYVENGAIYACVAGKSRVKDRVIEVECEDCRTLKKGDIVYGRIEEMYESVVLVRLDVEGAILPAGYATLHISDIKRGYVRSIKEEMKVGDIIKAVVKDTRRNVSIRTNERGLGVIKAFCSECRGVLAMKRGLVCEECGHTEDRYIAYPYGGEMLENKKREGRG
ncbi:MAG: exosome complex RNA-binding protein Csl4 [Candidatus Micrarchaeia archaeon]